MIVQAFFDFLNKQAIHAEALYILGDLFEVWWGDDNPDPLPQRVISELHTLSKRGTALYFLHGNRDFTVAKRFAREAACTLLPEMYLMNINKTRIELMHGDTLCIDDIKYQKYRRIIRNPLILWVLGKLPQTIRRKMAAKARSKSQQHNRNSTEYIMDVNDAAVRQQITRDSVDVLIHGHTHRPGRHSYEIAGKTAERIVLGDWTEQQGWFAAISAEGDVSLESFAIDTSIIS